MYFSFLISRVGNGWTLMSRKAFSMCLHGYCLTGGTGINLTPPPASIMRLVYDPQFLEVEVTYVLVIYG